MAKPSDGDMQVAKSKRVVFLRHGRTYMNDFIGGVHFGAPNFSDIFPETPENKSKYIDSPLTPEGIKQAQNLKSVLQRTRKLKDYGANKMEERLFGSLLDEIDLVVVSPLTRALETMDIGLYPLIKARNIPIVANPLASERLYLVSDVGQARKELKKCMNTLILILAYQTMTGHGIFNQQKISRKHTLSGGHLGTDRYMPVSGNHRIILIAG